MKKTFIAWDTQRSMEKLFYAYLAFCALLLAGLIVLLAVSGAELYQYLLIIAVVLFFAASILLAFIYCCFHKVEISQYEISIINLLNRPIASCKIADISSIEIATFTAASFFGGKGKPCKYFKISETTPRTKQLPWWRPDRYHICFEFTEEKLSALQDCYHGDIPDNL